MANLKQEYIDIKDIKHHVEHLSLSVKSDDSREQLVEDLLRALTKSGKYLLS